MTDPTGSITAFLHARYDELAESATGADGAHVYFDAIDDEARDFYLERDIPKYVLADLASKRAILDLAVDAPCCEHTPWGGTCAADNTIKLLALPFAAHPDYQESWKP